MDVRSIIKDPLGCILTHWGSVQKCPDAQEILSIAGKISEFLAEEKTVKLEKQLCAKQFKVHRGEESTISKLQSEMQGIASRLKELQCQRKEEESKLLAFFTQIKICREFTQPLQFRQKAVNTQNPEELSEIDVTLAGLGDEVAWDAYVDGHESASLYHFFRWQNLIEKTFGHRSYYFIARNKKKQIVGLLPTTRLRSWLFGDFGVSMPYFNYGGVISNHEIIAQRLLHAASEFYRQAGSTHLEVRETIAQSVPWPSSMDKVSMIRALPDSPEELSDQIGAKIRAQIKKARRENPKIHRGGKELIDKFYTVFSRHMRDLGTPVYAKSFFENIIDQWPRSASIILVELNDEPVATAFLLGNKDMLEIPWASTLRKVNPLSINMLLYWEVLCFAISKKYKYFDFGRSSKAHNTFRFKKQWGAVPVQHYWYYWLADGKPLPNLKPDNPKFQWAISIWQYLPIKLTKIIGPAIVKNLP